MVTLVLEGVPIFGRTYYPHLAWSVNAPSSKVTNGQCSDIGVKWSEMMYVEVLGDKRTMHIRVILY